MSDYYAKVDAAIEYLRNHLPSTFQLQQLLTSDTCFGSRSPERYDRLDIIIDADERVSCQIIFDSADYSFPPDIIFPHAPGCHLDCLPEKWILDDASCLLDWLISVQRKLCTKRDVPSRESPKETLSDAVHVISDDEDGHRPSAPVLNDTCRKFVQAWIKEMPDHVVQYDAEQYLSMALYISVPIPPRLWAAMQKRAKEAMEVRMDDFAEVSTARQTAPVIAYFQLEYDFPTTPILLTMISAVNMESSTVPSISPNGGFHANSTPAPDICEIPVDVNPSWSSEDMVFYVRNFILKEIPRFHSQLYHSLNTA